VRHLIDTQRLNFSVIADAEPSWQAEAA